MGGFLDNIGSGISQGASAVGSYLNAPPDQTAPGSQSLLSLFEGIPRDLLRGVAQLPGGLVQDALGRMMAPGSANTYRNLQSAGLLSNLMESAPGRTSLMTSPDVARLAGLSTIPVAPGTASVGAYPGLSPGDKPIFPYVTQVPRGLPPEVLSPEDQLRVQQARYFQSAADTMGGAPGGVGTGGELPPGATIVRTMGPHGPEFRIEQKGQPPYQPAPGPPSEMNAPPPGTPPGQPPATLPGRRLSTRDATPGESVDLGNGQTGTLKPDGTLSGSDGHDYAYTGRGFQDLGPSAPTAQGTGAKPPASTTAPVTSPAAPSGAPGAPGAPPPPPKVLAPGHYTFTDDQTGKQISGQVGGPGGGNNILTEANGQQHRWDGKNLVPLKGPGKAPVAAAPSPAPEDQSKIGYPSLAPGPDEQAPAVAPPLRAPAEKPPGKPPEQEVQKIRPEDRQAFFQAKQDPVAGPQIRAYLNAHPEFNDPAGKPNIDQQVEATAGFVKQWQADFKLAQDKKEAQMRESLRTAKPIQNQINSLEEMEAIYKRYITPDPKTGQYILQSLPDERNPNFLSPTVLGQSLGGTHTGAGYLISPGGRSLQEQRMTPGPQGDAAAMIDSMANGILASLSRATGISGRITNTELDLVRKAFVPNFEMDNQTSGLRKVENTLKILGTIHDKLASGKITDPVEAANAIRGAFGMSSGARGLGREEAPPRSLETQPGGQ